ncbi:MAG: hypothetical protein ABF743_00220 [Schleiferilactobacillus perolens]
MWLGVFETAHFAGSNRRHSVPAHFSRRLRSIGTARGLFSTFTSQIDSTAPPAHYSPSTAGTRAP